MKNLPYIDKLKSLFYRKNTSLLAVDLAGGLKMVDIDLSGEININAFQAVELGDNRKNEAIVNYLKDFVAQHNIQHKNAILIPALLNFFVKRIQLPAVPPEELLEAIKWKVKDELPFDLSKAIFDYKIVNKIVSADGSKVLDLICTAAEESEIREQVLLLKQAGLSCVSVTFAVLGYAKLIERYLVLPKDKDTGILHIGEKKSYFAVCRAGAAVFFRILPVVIDRLRESLAAELLTEKGKVRLTAEEINEGLFKYGIPCEGSTLFKDKMASSQVLAMLRPPLEILAQEIKRSLSYYQSQFQGKVDKVFVCAEGSLIPNLDKFLGKELSLDISDFSLTQECKVSSGLNNLEIAQSYAMIGLALSYSDTINLLPAEFRSEKIERFQKVSLGWVSFIASLLLVVSYLFARVGVGAYQRRLDNALFQLNVLSEIKNIKNKLDAFSSFSASVKSSQPRYARILAAISDVSGRDLLLNSLTISGDSKSGSISGYVKARNNNNPEAILTQFAGDLDRSGYFVKTTITKLTNASVQGSEAVMFEISFRMQ